MSQSQRISVSEQSSHVGMRMARHKVRAKRKAARDSRVAGGKEVNPSASGPEPWARRFVPGSKESGSALPASTIRVGLTCPPGRYYWVAGYRNPVLQEQQKKRPTISKRFSVGGPVSEHRAFQITLAWLWRRHDLCCSPPERRPS